jgi:predicted RNase H-like nuclease (RuvC/YqgF family)
VPSAEQVIKEGIDLGKMDAKLLEKIEELTLYMLELNKKIEQLEKENKNLRQNASSKN